jgi:hypothetical protein
MKIKLAPLMLLMVMACVDSREARRFARHVPPAEAAWFKIEFNQEFPEQGRKEIPGAIVAAIQVAIDDFLPWREPAPARITTDLEADAICRRQRQAWDVLFNTSPADVNVVLVAIMPAPGACRRGPPPMDEGVTYAIDGRTESILAVQTAAWQILPRSLEEKAARIHFPSQREALHGYTRIKANMAAAIQLAVEDFRPLDVGPPAFSSPEDACLYQRRSYDVTAVPSPDAIMLVRFDVNDGVCPPSVPPTIVDGVRHYPPLETPTYAIDLRTMRILTYASYPRQRIIKG